MCYGTGAQSAEARLTEELADAKLHIAAVEAECEQLREELLAMKRRSEMRVAA